jgi:hypothetical protein
MQNLASAPLFILQNKLSPKAQTPRGISNFKLRHSCILLAEHTKKGKVPEHPPQISNNNVAPD